MKTFIEKWLSYIGVISNPAGGWFPRKTTSVRKPQEKRISMVISSPDAFNARSAGRKQNPVRHTPAP